MSFFIGLAKVGIVMALVAAVPLHAEDDAGHFYTGGGAGAIKCPAYVDLMRQAKAQGLGTLG